MQDIQLNPFIFITLAALFLLWSIVKWLPGKKNSPPSPPKLPILGNLHQLGSFPHKSLQTLAQKHGPIMLLHLGSVPVLIVSSADAAREILKTHDTSFADRPQFKAFKKLVYGGRNITFSPYGPYWKKLRTSLVLQLLSSKRVQSFRSIREEETAHLLEKIGESSGPVNLSDMFNDFSNDLISRSAFGTKFRESEKGKKLVVLLIELMELLGAISIGDFVPWLRWLDRFNGFDERLDRVAKEMDNFLEDVIEERTKNGNQEKINGENFVDIMFQIQNDNKEEVSIGREGIKSIVLDALAGGTDTISTALEWTMTELLRHPVMMEKLRNEVREIVKDKDEITDGDLEKMHYLKAVIKESLRFHPPVPLLVPRVAREDVNIKGYDISRGTVVMINIWSIGRDQISWDQPEKFWPERFFNTSVDFKGSNFELIPFGAGRRGCPGMTYGIATIEFLLVNLVHKFYWELPNAAEGKDLDMGEIPGLAVHRAVPLLAVATKIT